MKSAAISHKRLQGRRAAILALAAATAFSLAFPTAALAVVSVDDQELVQGENSVGGGTATLTESVLNMVDVVAATMSTDEDLTINFNGGNEIEDVYIEGDASVEMNFAGENEVEDTHVLDQAEATINADGHNDFDEVKAYGDSSVTINVTGENDFETIEAAGNANIEVKGTTCQTRDIVNVGDDEDDAGIMAQNGDVTIDHVTVNLQSKEAYVGSYEGNLKIDTSKVAAADGNENTEVVAGGTMDIAESVVDIAGTVYSDGLMTIEHSDVKVEKPADEYDTNPYRVSSKTGIKLVRERNGAVEKGTVNGDDVHYVKTADDPAELVDLKADGIPGYYACKGKGAFPLTSDSADASGFALIAAVSAVAALCAYGRRRSAVPRS